MPRYRGRASGVQYGLGFIAFVLFALWSAGCDTASAPGDCAGCTSATATTSATAISTSPPTAIAPKRTLPPPSPTPLPTFHFHPAESVTPLREPVHATLTMDPKTAYHVWTDWALGPSERQTNRLKDVAYSRYEPGDIVVEWWLYNYPAAESMRAGARVDACTILMGIGRIPYSKVILHGYLWLRNTPGNKDVGSLVVSLTYDKRTVEAMDFYNDCHTRVFELADQSLIAPDFR